MLAAALRVGMGVRYRQLEGTGGKMIGESKTHSFSQLRKRMGTLDVDTNQGGVITVSDSRHSRIPAVDTTGLKQHNRGEWMGKKWKVKRGFVERHVTVDTQTMEMIALSVTGESVGDVTEFRSLLGQSMDAVGAGGAPCHSKCPGQNALAGERGDGAPPLAPPRSDHSGDDPGAADIVYGDAAYGSRDSVAACACAGVVRASCTGST